MMRKLLSTLIVLCLSLSVFSVQSYAQSDNQPIETKEYKIIDDPATLYQKAKNGITDIKIKPKTTQLINTLTKESKAIDVLSTTQLAKEVIYSNGEIEQTYVTTNIVPVKPEDLDLPAKAKTEKPTTQTFTIQTDTPSGDWDDSISVYAYANINWSKLSNGTLKMNSASGSWSNYDPSRVGLKNRHAYICCNDQYHYNQKTNLYPSSNYYNFNASSWYPIENSGFSNLGQNMYVDLYTFNNPSYSWTLHVQDNVQLPI